MINALYEPFPDFIEADGAENPIITDFREWLRFADMLADSGLSDREKLMLMSQWLTEPPEEITAGLVRALFSFYRADELEPDPPESPDDEVPVIKKPPVFSWIHDARFVIGDFRRFYGIDLLSVSYLHWWEFRCLFAALPDDSACQKRIAYRSAELGSIKSKAERERIARIQRLIALPYEMSDDEISAVFDG